MKLLYATTLLLAALLSDGSLPVLAAEPGEQSFTYKESGDGSQPTVVPLPEGRKFTYKELRDNSLPVPAKASGHSFSYEGPNGPDNWATEWATCGGKFQSPIEIDEHLVQPVRLSPLVFRGFDEMPISSMLINNGHTVMLQMNMTRPASLSGGPLRGNYLFQQLHFHWGNNDSLGSENQVNNHTFPMELHIVTYNQKYGSFDKAQLYKDGLAVLAVFFEIHGDGDPDYTEITRVLPHLKEPNSKVLLEHGVTLLSLLPEIKHLYFTYNGSLTTPPCLEVVTWIDFKQPVLLSYNQVKEFRTIHSPDGPLMFNFRPIQSLSDRTVLFNVDYNSAVSPFVTSFMLGTFLVLMLGVLQ